MQQEKIEFPKFTVPGQTNWVKWALAAVGGLVVLSAFRVRRGADQARPDSAHRHRGPGQGGGAAGSFGHAPGRPAAWHGARGHGATAPDTAAAPAADDAPASAKAHRPRRSSNRGHTRSLAKASSSSSSSKSSGKPDAIDELLKKFK
jgi:hypothetical protein